MTCPKCHAMGDCTIEDRLSYRRNLLRCLRCGWLWVGAA